MLVCRQCNRIKSWSCEHCNNWLKKHDPSVCLGCYWASPENFKHVAMQDIRQLDVTWVGDEVVSFDSMAKAAQSAGMTPAEFAKSLIEKNASSPVPKRRKPSSN